MTDIEMILVYSEHLKYRYFSNEVHLNDQFIHDLIYDLNHDSINLHYTSLILRKQYDSFIR